MLKITLPSGKVIEANEGQTIIDASEAARVTLPYSCRDGRCSSCKCRIIGKTKLIYDELGLTESEKADGWKLACSRSPIDDIEIEIEDLSEFNLSKPKTYPVKIVSLNLLSKDVIKLLLRLPPGCDFMFLEGQYIDLIGPHNIKRSYSLASCSDDKILELHVKRVNEGLMSNYLFDNAKVDDLLRINGPRGTFILRHNIKTNIIFLATGTGIAPIKSMLMRLNFLKKSLMPKSVKLFWGAREQINLYLDPMLFLPSLDYTPVLSRNHQGWAGMQGHVQDVMCQNVKNFENTQVYACGSGK